MRILRKRLAWLEERSRKRVDLRRNTCASVVDEIRAFLEARGLEPSPKESLAESFAGALRITSKELRTRLQAVAQRRSTLPLASFDLEKASRRSRLRL